MSGGALFLRNAELLTTYNRAFNADLNRALAALDHLPAALAAQLEHLLVMDRLWLTRLGAAAGREQPPPIRDRQAWYAARRVVDTDIAQFVHDLGEQDLGHEIVFVTEAESMRERCASWAAMTHMFNHQSLHRGEILRLLTQAGVRFGNSDILPMIVE